MIDWLNVKFPAAANLDEGVPFQLHVEYAGDSDGASNSVETKIGDLRIIAILKTDAEGSQKRSPT